MEHSLLRFSSAQTRKSIQVSSRNGSDVMLSQIMVIQTLSEATFIGIFNQNSVLTGEFKILMDSIEEDSKF
jgi:hypothetical protein